MMKNIFVSRPTWIPKAYEEGLNHFLGFLESKKLSPRTLGSTDYPTECPLDEVLGIMKQCSGAIILGYPQITISAGKIKNKDISSEIILATEWNHIEAGLAYAQGLPILIIHHENVARGIFDRGTMPKFIHSIDLSNPSWILNSKILGAFKKWETDVLSKKQLRPDAVDVSFDEKTGTLTCDDSPYRFCHKCYHEKNNELVPLTKKNWGGAVRCVKKIIKIPIIFLRPRDGHHEFSSNGAMEPANDLSRQAKKAPQSGSTKWQF